MLYFCFKIWKKYTEDKIKYTVDYLNRTECNTYTAVPNDVIDDPNAFAVWCEQKREMIMKKNHQQ